jgi:hypothetical protein
MRLAVDGPYWTDIDRWNRSIGRSKPLSFIGSVAPAYGWFCNLALRLTRWHWQQRVTADTVVTLKHLRHSGYSGWSSIWRSNNDTKVDRGETGELNSDAKGLWIEDFDFGMAMMTPVNPLDFVK